MITFNPDKIKTPSSLPQIDAEYHPDPDKMSSDEEWGPKETEASSCDIFMSKHSSISKPSSTYERQSRVQTEIIIRMYAEPTSFVCKHEDTHRHTNIRTRTRALAHTEKHFIFNDKDLPVSKNPVSDLVD